MSAQPKMNGKSGPTLRQLSFVLFVAGVISIFGCLLRMPPAQEQIPLVPVRMTPQGPRSRFSHKNTSPFSDSWNTSFTSFDTSIKYLTKSTQDPLLGVDQQEVRHIGFLKVHKAGSTTLQNVFLRFAIRRNLTLVLPVGTNYFSSYRRGHHSILPLPKDTRFYDILACHSVFSKETYSKVLPQDSVYLAIVRDPLQTMISAAYYYRDVWGSGYLKRVPKANFISSLIRYPELYDKPFFSATKNVMARDFGFTPMHNTPESISDYLHFLNQTFAFVLVLEKFNESLILMKRLLNFQMKDIVYTATNSYMHSPVMLNDSDIELFKKRNYLDVAVFDFFHTELDRRLSMSGTDFYGEVDQFKSVLSVIKDFCKDIGKGKSVTITASKWNQEFKITSTDCKIMNMKELSLLKRLRLRHSQMLRNPSHSYSAFTL